MKLNWLLKPNVKLAYLAQNITVAIVLQITEHLTEQYFICQCNKCRICFVWMYFSIPAAAFTAFSWSFQKGNIFMKKCRKGATATQNAVTTCSLCLRTLYPGLCWIVILLIDGKYAACALDKRCSEDNKTMSTWKADDEDMVYNRMRSKIWGLTVVLVLVVFYVFYLCCDCCRSPKDRYDEMYGAQLEENKEEIARTYAKIDSLKKAREECKDTLTITLPPIVDENIWDVIRK